MKTASEPVRAFGWDRFGLSSRLTAAGQLTDVKRDAHGLVASVAASKGGKADRTIRREYDGHDRVTRVDYGNGEVETFAYDRWGRLAAHTRGRLKETYAYDHFGRLVEKAENGTVFAYAYDAWGRRTRRTIRFADGGVVRVPAGDWLTPGIRIEAANLLVEDCEIDSDDDAICFKSDLRDFTVENVVVRNCRLSSNCNAIKFGTSWVGKGRNILVEGRCRRPSDPTPRTATGACAQCDVAKGVRLTTFFASALTAGA